MKKQLLCDYFNEISKYEDADYLYSLIAYSAAPTIFNEKPSSLVVFNDNNKQMLKNWDKIKENISKIYKIKYYELHRYKQGVIVLFYKPTILSETLSKYENKKFLNMYGYEKLIDLNQKLDFLKEKYKCGCCPHEIGIFLGYPVKDVQTFINCPNKKCLMCGYWKVYNDLNNAKQTFDKFNDKKRKVISLILNGVHPSRILDY